MGLEFGDSTCAEAWVKKKRAGSRISAKLIGEMFRFAKEEGFTMLTKHVPGKENVAADRLSRRFDWSEERCCDLVAEAHGFPRDWVYFLPVPEDVQEYFDGMCETTLLLPRWKRTRPGAGAGQF